MKHDAAHRFWVCMTVLAGLAGLLYSSWPLGYLLNPSASKKGLASALEALNQPYNWVFITGDVLSGLIILITGWLIWRRYRASVHYGHLLSLILINWSIFALGTIADALLPEHCLPGAASCPSWHQDHILFAHGILSILAAAGLFAVLLLIWWRNRNLLFYGLILGYSVFALLSLYEALNPAQGNFSQHYYLTLCGLWIALIPYAIHRTFFAGEPESSGKKSTP
ncbi:MAG TPA: DUF998 domain-containing protein [Candidatus Dormibacteraeota bacterium]|nr:DUF998 domain-containing protein [Candidatus Dormibacteraeota bacterium]